MKKIKIIIVLVILSTITACDVLDLKPADFYSFENYWTNKDQVERFLNGLHNRLRMRQSALLMLGEFRGGLMDGSVSSVVGQTKYDIPVIANTLSEINPGITEWGNLYMDILQINHALDALNNKVDFLNQAEKNNYLGMLYGLRAFYYFHLLRSWGGVPLLDSPDVLSGISSPSQLNKERSSETEIMNFIK